MAVPQSWIDAFAAIDRETDEIAAVIRELRLVVSQQMTAEDVASVQARLESIASTLDQVAAEPPAA